MDKGKDDRHHLDWSAAVASCYQEKTGYASDRPYRTDDNASNCEEQNRRPHTNQGSG